MKIYFNALGVITSIDFTDEAIRQGNVGNTVKAYFTGKNNANHTAKINFTRPDGSRLSNLVMTPSPSNSTLFTFVLNDEWYLAISGNASLTIYLYDGNGNIVASGQVAFTIEDTDYDDEPDRPTTAQYDSLLALVSAKNNIVNSIVVLEDIDGTDLSDYDEGQLFYDKVTKLYYAKNSLGGYEPAEGNGILGKSAVVPSISGNLLVADLITLFGDSIFRYNYSVNSYLCKITGVSENTVTVDIFELSQKRFYSATVDATNTFINSIISESNLIEFVQKRKDGSGSYAYTHDQSGTGHMPIDVNNTRDTLVKRDGAGSIKVEATPASAFCATSKQYVDNTVSNAIATVNQNEFTLVDISQYPSESNFLNNATGSEGRIYLYPIDTSESPDFESGYKQYIWENNGWLFIGKTIIDLSDYYTKTESNNKFVSKTNSAFKLYSTNNLGNQNVQTYSTNADASTIAKRTSDGNIAVATTPTDNSHATSKKYVDDQDALKVSKTNVGEKVYGTDELGAQMTYDVDSDLVGSGAIVRRETSTGTVVVGTPTSNTHATTKKYVDDSIATAISAVYRYKGTKTVAQLNALTGMVVGDTYNVSDSGTLTAGSVQVRAGDNVAWTEDNVWDKLAEDIDWDTYNETFLAAGFVQAGEIDSVPEQLTFDSEGNITNPDWTGEIELDYMSPPISDISISDVPTTLTFDVTQDYDNMITNADWTGIMTITY